MRPLLLALVLLAAPGCRESLVADPLVPPTDAPPTVQGSLYLKGVGETLGLGAQTTLRCQGHPDATRYVWDFTGDGEVTTASPGGARTLTVAGYRVGPVEVRVLAYGADGTLVGRASHSFTVAR